jgi:hypothetical protein
MIRYYGLYFNVHRGKVRKTQEKANPYLILEEDEPLIPPKGWAEMIKRNLMGNLTPINSHVVQTCLTNTNIDHREFQN